MVALEDVVSQAGRSFMRENKRERRKEDRDAKKSVTGDFDMYLLAQTWAPQVRTSERL
jgi:hypothetical protein